jgi:uncharacterized protein (DUF1778 family)
MPAAPLANPSPERARARQRREATVNIRIASETRDLIDSAAAATGKSRSEFMVDIARKHAVDVLLDQRFFTLNEEQYDAFLAVLDNPPPPGPKLRALMKKTPLWEK